MKSFACGHAMPEIPRKSSSGWHRARKGTEKGGPCPECGHRLSRVYDGEGPARYRECAACGTRWRTVEIFERRIA